MRCNSANMLRQASRAIDPETDRCAYAFMLEEMAGHIEQVRDGSATLDEFAEFYMIRPDTAALAKASPSARSSDGVVKIEGV